MKPAMMHGRSQKTLLRSECSETDSFANDTRLERASKLTPHLSAPIVMKHTAGQSTGVRGEGQRKSGDETEQSADRCVRDEHEGTRVADDSTLCTDHVRHRTRGKTRKSAVFQPVWILFVTCSNEGDSTLNLLHSQTRSAIGSVVGPFRRSEPAG